MAALPALALEKVGPPAGGDATPGTRPDGVKAMRTQALQATDNGLRPFFSASGNLRLSADAVGTNTASAVVQVEKPVGATVHKAFLFGASTGFSGYTPPDGAITLDGTGVTWDPAYTMTNSIYSVNVAADVTDLLRTKLDSAPAGLIDVTVAESNTYDMDGEILAVVWHDASSKVRTVYLMYGAQSTNGDSFAVSLNEPLKPSSTATMSLGISFGYQVGGQYSRVAVNGTVLSESAGGQDDGEDEDGALITVGGIGDDPANPVGPNMYEGCGIDPRCDDELYDLKAIAGVGATEFVVDTINPSDDDNVFFAAFDISGVTASVGESVVISPSGTTQQVGTTHEVIVRAQNASGDAFTDGAIELKVTAGPNAGQTLTGVRLPDGRYVARYTSTATGTDTLVATYTAPDGSKLESSPATQNWAPRVQGTFGGMWPYDGTTLRLNYSYGGAQRYLDNLQGAADNWNKSGANVELSPWGGSPAAIHLPIIDVDRNDTWWAMTVAANGCWVCGYTATSILLNQSELDGETEEMQTKVVTHELGHALGLMDTLFARVPWSTPSVMWQGRINDRVKSTPQAIDVARVDAMYPAAAPAPAPKRQRYELHFDHATYSTVPQLNEAATNVVTATVLSKTVEEGVSPGVDEAGDPIPPVPQTKYVVRLTKVFKGGLTENQDITISMTGGSTPDGLFVVDGGSDMNVGGEYLFFLTEERDGLYYPLAGGAAVAPKQQNGSFLLPAEATGLESAKEVTEQEVGGDGGPPPPPPPPPAKVPTVTLSSPAPAVVDGKVPVTATFSHPVNGFVVGNLVLVNAKAENFKKVDGTTYTWDLVPLAEGKFSVQVPAGSGVSETGDGSYASNVLERTYADVAPVVTIAPKAGQPNPTTEPVVRFVVTASEPVGDLDVADVVVSGTATGGAASVTRTGPSAFEVTVSGLTGDGTVIVGLVAGALEDAAGNGSAAVQSTPVTYDATPDALSLEVVSAEAKPGKGVVTMPLVLGYGNGDQVTLGSSSSDESVVPDSGIVISGNGKSRTVTVNPLPGAGTSTITLTLTRGADTVTQTLTVLAGDSSANTLTGGDGIDLVFARGGADKVMLGGGDDVVLGGGRADRLFGGDGDDVLFGQRGADQLTGDAGADRFVGGGGNNELLDFDEAEGDTLS